MGVPASNGAAPSVRIRQDVSLTFDDVLLQPRHSLVHPKNVDTSTWFTRGIALNVPLVSAAMDTVTEAATAICMARHGGLGIVHKNLTPEQQAQEVRRVKRSESGMVVDPVTVTPAQTLRQALALMHAHGFSGLPVVEGRRPVGILTSRDVRFETNLDQPVGRVMTRDPICVRQGIALEEALALLHKHRIEKLLVVDGGGDLLGLITVKDIRNAQTHPHANKDSTGRLRVGHPAVEEQLGDHRGHLQRPGQPRGRGPARPLGRPDGRVGALTLLLCQALDSARAASIHSNSMPLFILE